MAIVVSINKYFRKGRGYILWLSLLATSKSLEQGFPNCFASVPINNIKNFQCTKISVVNLNKKT
jgi:hypothetical protein